MSTWHCASLRQDGRWLGGHARRSLSKSRSCRRQAIIERSHWRFEVTRLVGSGVGGISTQSSTHTLYSIDLRTASTPATRFRCCLSQAASSSRSRGGGCADIAATARSSHHRKARRLHNDRSQASAAAKFIQHHQHALLAQLLCYYRQLCCPIYCVSTFVLQPALASYGSTIGVAINSTVNCAALFAPALSTEQCCMLPRRPRYQCNFANCKATFVPTPHRKATTRTSLPPSPQTSQLV